MSLTKTNKMQKVLSKTSTLGNFKHINFKNRNNGQLEPLFSKNNNAIKPIETFPRDLFKHAIFCKLR